MTTDTLADKRAAKAAEPKPAKAKAEKPVKYCLHGCGQTTKGGDFVIGHDAKLKSILQKAFVAAPDKPVDLGGKKATPLHGRKPMEIAAERGWEDHLNKAKARDTEKANKPKREKRVKGGPAEVGAEVQFEYRGAKHKGEVVETSGQRARVTFTHEGKSETRAFGIESLTVTKAAPKATEVAQDQPA